jgi:hypothetical protein
MIANRSRDVPNGSLYLVTGCIKTGNWGIGALYGQPAETDYLEFTSGGQPQQRTYSWKKSGPIAGKVGPTSTDIIMGDREEPNQCVFLRGYKISLGRKLWKNLKGKALSVPSNREQSFRSSRTSINNSSQYNANQNTLPWSTRGGSASGHVTHRYRGSIRLCGVQWHLYRFQYDPRRSHGSRISSYRFRSIRRRIGTGPP